MKLNHEEFTRDSEEDFGNRLQILSNSGAGVIHVRATEVMRAVATLRRVILSGDDVYKEWDVKNGMREFTIDNLHEVNRAGDGNPDLSAQLTAPITAASDTSVTSSEAMHYFIYVNPQYWLENNPVANHHILQACSALPATNIRMILVTPDINIPENISETTIMLRMGTPGHTELVASLDSILGGLSEDVVEELSADDKDRICFTGAGMSREAFEMYASLAIIDTAARHPDAEGYLVTPDDIIAGINEGKTEVINKNDILELYPTEGMDEVGGMNNLKAWVSRRKDCYSDEAVDFGVEPPKGMVFVGPPGTGKSLAAKAVAGELGVPLVRLDFGRIFNSLVGASEERVRTALRMVESMAPIVLFVDEIDKGLGGIGGSGGDSGTSSRVLGTFLTWLQENKRPVFTMVTANNVTALPPELLRRGRFDAIFSTGLPTQPEREEVARIHIEKRGYDPEDLGEDALRRIAIKAKSYVPAEIESAVKDGLVDAFAEGEEFTADHVVAALEAMVPLSTAFNKEIQAMTLWAKTNATPASSDDKTPPAKSSNIRPLRKAKVTRTRATKDKK